MDELATLFVSTGDKEDVLADAKKTAETMEGKDAEFAGRYVKAMEKIIAKGDSYVSKEVARLSKLIGGEGVKADRKDLFMLRRNILKAFE